MRFTWRESGLAHGATKRNAPLNIVVRSGIVLRSALTAATGTLESRLTRGCALTFSAATILLVNIAVILRRRCDCMLTIFAPSSTAALMSQVTLLPLASCVTKVRATQCNQEIFSFKANNYIYMGRRIIKLKQGEAATIY
jgi:hypothetical protein